jgi:hypothetical protein
MNFGFPGKTGNSFLNYLIIIEILSLLGEGRRGRGTENLGGEVGDSH